MSTLDDSHETIFVHLAGRCVFALLSVPEAQYGKSGAIVLTCLCKGGTIGKAENNSSNCGLKFSAVASESCNERDGQDEEGIGVEDGSQ